MKKIILDLDMTLTRGKGSKGYEDAVVNDELLSKLIEYRAQGFYIVINTSRNMNTYNNNTGLINKNTLPVILKWLTENDIPYDEIYIGKPWCGFDGFYIDDKAIRPAEFIKYSYDEIITILRKDR